MIKKFLYTFLFLTHSTSMCGGDGFKPELNQIISFREVCFIELTSAQKNEYLPQINVPNSRGWLPLEHAVYRGRTEIVAWLLSNGVAVDSPRILQSALNPWSFECVSSKILSSLLAHGVSTDCEIEGKTPFHFMRDQFEEYYRSRLFRPSYCNTYREQYAEEMRKSVMILEQDAECKGRRWSVLRSAWCGEVVKGRWAIDARKQAAVAANDLAIGRPGKRCKIVS